MKELREPTVLRDLVSFQEDSIVSRVIHKNRSGSVTLFAFSAGQSLSEHNTPHDAIVVVIEGDGVFEVGGRRLEVERDQVLLLPANVPHAVHAEAPFKMMLTMLKDTRSNTK